MMTMTDYFGEPRLRLGALAAPRHFVVAGFLRPLRERIERRRAIEALSGLDDRLLRDVGVNRVEIPEVVAQRSDRAGGVRSAWRDAVALYRLARLRRQMIRDLDSLPDWILNDIGVPRWNIEDAVDRSVARQVAEGRRAAGRRPADAAAALREVASRLRAGTSPRPGHIARPTDA